MYKQVAKKTGLLLGGLTIAVAGFLGGYSDDTGLTIGSPAKAQFYLWCVGQCTGYVSPDGTYCERVAYCIDNLGNVHGPFAGHHNECCF